MLEGFEINPPRRVLMGFCEGGGGRSAPSPAAGRSSPHRPLFGSRAAGNKEVERTEAQAGSTHSCSALRRPRAALSPPRAPATLLVSPQTGCRFQQGACNRLFPRVNVSCRKAEVSILRRKHGDCSETCVPQLHPAAVTA